MPRGLAGAGHVVKVLAEGAVNLTPPVRRFEKAPWKRLSAVETPARRFASETPEREALAQVRTHGLERNDDPQIGVAQNNLLQTIESGIRRAA
jgi:hypothetical protein